MTKHHHYLLISLLIGAGFCNAKANALSPLDGLTGAEYEIVAEVLSESGKVDDSSRFAMVNLAEPD